MEDTLPDRVRLGAFEVDLRAGEVRADEGTVRLQEQPFQILLMLVERGGEMVTREEIQNKLWPNDTVVEFDHSINAAIKKLRQALGDSAERPQYIETVARRGYRLLVPVERPRPVEDELSNRDESHRSQDPELERGDNDASRILKEALAHVQSQQVAAHHPVNGNLIGKRVSHYRVLEVLGGGGMGMVYKAEDLKLGRQVALKFLPEELAWEPSALRRFEREARAASCLDHPNICTIYGVEEYEEQPFIVMQLLHGETLRDRLAALVASHQTLALEALLNYAIQICEGLQATHDRGIIHRDIKPANIFLTTSGLVKILDFGLAKLTKNLKDSGSDSCQLGPEAKVRKAAHAGPSPPSDGTATRAGGAMGTAGYMSPEQLRGEKLDARTDLFSFGVVLYEMATGRRAFSGETAAVVHDAILNQPPIPLRELNSTLPAKLVSTIDKALEKNRDLRYQSAAELRADL